MTRWNVALTWESDTAAPDTIRVCVDAGSVGTAAARALRLGQRQRPGKRFRSVVLVLERDEAATGDAQDGGNT